MTHQATTASAAASSSSSSSSAPRELYDTLKWNGWGEEGVEMRQDNDHPTWVRHVNNKPLRNLLDFLHKEIQGGVGPKEIPALSPSVSLAEAVDRLHPPVINEPFLHELAAVLASDQVRRDGRSRLAHCVGKNYRDLWRVRRGAVERAPDCIVLPNNHDDCVAIMRLAHAHNVVIVPFGGGTTVTGGVEASAMEMTRMVVSVDMRRMRRMLSIDTASCIATFETGVLGPDLDKQLAKHGFMLGHDPDSYLYSTLGGWIGARGSGAMSNQYGDIEQMVVSLKVATPTGVVHTPVASRTCGVDLNALFIGSEGAFGIVTEATVKIEPLPEERYYGGYLFPCFEAAFEAFRVCNTRGIRPCVMRLYDEDDFRMSLAMSTTTPGRVERLLSNAVKTFLHSARGWDMHKVSLVILGFEGTRDRIAQQRRETAAVFARFGGFSVGRSAGDSWQEKKYDLPYIRDFALSVSHWADVFETSVLYSQAIPCWRAVKQAVRQVWRENGAHGWVACHTAHQYRHGCCLYFTFASAQRDENDMKIFLEIKRRAMEEMLRYTGNLTHHHGIGYEHVPWMTRFMGDGCMNILYTLKHTLDPKSICNPGKLLPSPRQPSESEEAWRSRQDAEMLFDKMGVPGAVTTQSRL